MGKRCNNLWIVNKFAQASKRLQIVIAWKFNDGWKMFFQKRCVCSLWKVSKFPLDTKWFKTINASIWKKHNTEHVCLMRKCVALKYISNDFVHACAHGQKNQHSCGVISVWYRQSLIRIGHKIKPLITFLFTFTMGNKLNQSPCKELFTGNLSP